MTDGFDKIEVLYSEYLSVYHDMWNRYKSLQEIQYGERRYKESIIPLFFRAIKDKDVQMLQFGIAAASHDGVDTDYTEVFKKIILEQWHEEHEDIVSIVNLYLRDDVFTDALWEIAMKPKIYRKYDDELESTLRKCVHALKAIGTPKANAVLEKLVRTGNSNVQYALEMYK